MPSHVESTKPFFLSLLILHKLYGIRDRKYRRRLFEYQDREKFLLILRAVESMNQRKDNPTQRFQYKYLLYVFGILLIIVKKIN